MALPADRFANIVYQDTNDRIMEMESLAKSINPKVYAAYPYSDLGRKGTSTVKLDGVRQAVLNRRKIRILGALLNVAWTTNIATTQAAIATAVNALSL